jgi:hypothetical protein
MPKKALPYRALTAVTGSALAAVLWWYASFVDFMLFPFPPGGTPEWLGLAIVNGCAIVVIVALGISFRWFWQRAFPRR